MSVGAYLEPVRYEHWEANRIGTASFCKNALWMTLSRAPTERAQEVLNTNLTSLTFSLTFNQFALNY
jgi:hypothetical protein